VSENKAQNPVTAMDIVLEPDATMIERAQAANAALRKNSPKGYSLDEEHRPHISVMGGYVYTAIPLKEIGLGGIVVEPTPDMMRLQRKLIAALAPFMSPTGTDAAYAKTPSAPVINQATLDAVATYLSEHAGEHYSPHVTIGVGTAKYLDTLLAAPFPAFNFSAVGVSAYQFGNFWNCCKAPASVQADAVS
jgi:hypothetical protein